MKMIETTTTLKPHPNYRLQPLIVAAKKMPA